ncbi:MAG: sodium:proton antiporter [Phycisphaerae bacterium]|nr:sodium:proton antiporter [Phycisphaerae bacterium]
MSAEHASHPGNPASRAAIRRVKQATAILGVAVLLGLSLHSSPGFGNLETPPHWVIGIIPFVGVLGAIAIFPLVPALQHWWESNLNRLLVALAAAGATLAYYGVTLGFDAVSEAASLAGHEYVPFILLLASLFVVSGGISIRADLEATPAVNTAILAFGTLIASVVGTTGASMLLIRMLLETNKERRHVVHTVVAFIFLVSNIGGSLLPIGDPPLFLGFLRGVPFLWTLNLWVEWAAMSGALLLLYYLYDRRQHARETARNLRRDRTQIKPIRVRGTINLIWLAGIVLSVALVKDHLTRDLLLAAAAGLSLLTTPRGVRQENAFSWGPILEVAALFLGIFVSMQVPLSVLQHHGAHLGLTQPWQFFWATGVLSSFLDNAPTYLVFLRTAEAITVDAGPGVLALADRSFVREDLLVGVSLGAVFMGANTYIGNGPNFMVKAIAESRGVRMPSFLGYMLYSGVVLIPLFLLMTAIFLRP